MSSYSKETIKALMEGTLSWQKTKQIISGEKDEDRFERYLQILQEKVPWPETIVVPLTDSLFVIRKREGSAGSLIVKCECGHEFCTYQENWKMHARIHVRDTEELIEQIMPYSSDTDWMVIREYYCPECFKQLEVEAVPPGYPVLFDFLPDIEGFYRLNPELKKKIFYERKPGETYQD